MTLYGDPPRFSQAEAIVVEVLSEKTVLGEVSITTGLVKYDYGLNKISSRERVGRFHTTKATHLFILEIIPAPEVGEGRIRYNGFWVGHYIHHDNHAYM